MRILVWAIIFCITNLAGCVESTTYAPVTEVSSIDAVPKSGTYRVRPDDTLYSIAWRYGLDYRYLAKINNIPRPYHIEPSQIIYLRTAHIGKKLPHIFPKSSLSIEKEPTAVVSYWQWPARGPIIGTFSGLNKGINIGGRLGAFVYAAAPGKVVYSGNGLRAYGNLIIIKHNSVFLSAYAHNSKVFVREGEWVQSGQKIAEMGTVAPGRVMLHFEIRRSGKPINPLSYLGRR